MTKDLKKVIASLIAGGAIAGGGLVAKDRADCVATVLHEGEKICITAELKEAIESQLLPNAGFGGVRLGETK
jgi:hypothetical protein